MDHANDAKIVGIEQLLAIRQSTRASGKTLVLCHGCFDIVHPGHIHHLQYARSLGDFLVVSVSADPQVNKGAARPLIPEDLRCRSLAALQCVDAVYLNRTPTAVELLDALRPDVYVKGREYEHNLDPRFQQEKQVVEANGGRIVFSSGDVVFSSTALINSLGRPGLFDREKLTRFCARYGLGSASLYQRLHRFRGMPVVVIGDYILDRYHQCDAAGIAGESPMMALRTIGTTDFDGGAAVIARHLAALGARPVLVTSLADDDVSLHAEMRLRADGVEVEAPRQRPDVVVKQRYLVDDTKLFKVDHGRSHPLDSITETALAERIVELSAGAAAVIFADFGFGLVTSGLLRRVMPEIRPRVGTIAADVSGRQSNLLQFQGVDLLCPTEREVRETLQDFGSGLGAVVAGLLQRTGARNALITLGKQGLVTFEHPGAAREPGLPQRLRSEYLPTLGDRAVDPLGCGDALLATATLTLASGGGIQAAALLGSMAAAIELQRFGNVPVGLDDLSDFIHNFEPARGTLREAG